MKITIRLAEEKDAEKFVEWSRSTPNNLFDPAISTYPSLITLAADKGDETISYVPFHPVVVIESIAHKPDITPRENAVVFRKAQDAIEALAKQKGIAECWWMCADESLIKFAQRHGYEVVKTTVLRKKVGQ